MLAHAIPEMTASILIPIFVFAYLLFVDWRMALASLASAVLGNVIYVPYKIGKLQIQGFSEPATQKIK